MSTETCLSRETLRALHSGRLSGGQLESVASHLENCGLCLDVLQRLDKESPVNWQELATGYGDNESTASLVVIQRLLNSPAKEPATSLVLPHELPGYTLLRLIGQGGMGSVYLGVQHSLQRNVAVKIPNPQAGREAVVRFLAEAHAVARLDHPHIVPIYEVVDNGRDRFFAMAFIDGPSLQQRLRSGPLEIAEVLRILRPVCDAVACAHQQGLIHRDLKPANILLTKDGVPKLTDFGLVRRLDHADGLTIEGQVLGTPAFMAPEQARGEAADARTDVYALGATLYCLLTGTAPFAGHDALEVLQRVVQREATSPRKLRPGVSRDLETICLKCLEKAPAQRYQTAAEVGAELARVSNGQPILARPISTVNRVARWARRQPLMASLAGGLVVIAIVAGALGLFLNQSNRQAKLDRRQSAEDLQRSHRNARKIADDLFNREEFVAARPHYQALLAEVMPLAQSSPQEFELQREVYEIIGTLGQCARRQGQLKEAKTHFSQCLVELQRLTPLFPAHGNRLLTEQAKTLAHLGRCETNDGNVEQAKQHFAAALQIFCQMQGVSEAELQDDAEWNISETLSARGTASNRQEAARDFEQALAIRQRATFPNKQIKLYKVADLQGNCLNAWIHVVKPGDPRMAEIQKVMDDHLAARTQLANQTRDSERKHDLVIAQYTGLICAYYFELDLKPWLTEAHKARKAIEELQEKFPLESRNFVTHAKILAALSCMDPKLKDSAHEVISEAVKVCARGVGVSPWANEPTTTLIAIENTRRSILALEPPYSPIQFWVTDKSRFTQVSYQAECLTYLLMLEKLGFRKEASDFAAQQQIAWPSK